jgi:hypothetical protein
MENVVIKVLNLEHGQKVKKYFQSLNLPKSTLRLDRLETFKWLEDSYYGVKNNEFGCWLKDNTLNIITLPEEDLKKWKIRVTPQNKEELTQWLKRQPNIDRSYDVKGYVTSIPRSDNSYMDYGENETCEEIDIETFRKITTPEKWWVRFTGDDVKDQVIFDWFNQGIGEASYKIKDRIKFNKGLVYPSKVEGRIFSAYTHMMDNDRLPEKYTEISYEQFLEIAKPITVGTPDASTQDSITDIKTVSQPQKPMNAIKTKTIKINGLDREVTVAVLITAGTKIKAGYSVKNPEDKTNQELANMIALGRADKEKTAIDTGMYITDSMRKKFILYAIADNIFGQIERGTIQIKGVK